MDQLDPVFENLSSLLNMKSLLQTLGVCSNMRRWMLFIHFVFLFIWDGGHCLEMLCSLLDIRSWTDPRNIFFCIEHELAVRIQKLSTLHLIWESEQSPETFGCLLNKRWQSELQRFLLFSAEDGGQGPEISFYLSNTRKSVESRNLISVMNSRRLIEFKNFLSFLQHEPAIRVKKLYWTRDGGQSPETRRSLLNRKLWTLYRKRHLLRHLIIFNWTF
jgi:hypothetical protein